MSEQPKPKSSLAETAARLRATLDRAREVRDGADEEFERSTADLQVRCVDPHAGRDIEVGDSPSTPASQN